MPRGGGGGVAPVPFNVEVKWEIRLCLDIFLNILNFVFYKY